MSIDRRFKAEKKQTEILRVVVTPELRIKIDERIKNGNMSEYVRQLIIKDLDGSV